MRQRGFTVLEVMLASTLLAVFLAALFGLIWSTANFRNLVEEKTAPNSVGPVVLDRIVEDLENILVEPYKEFDALKAELDSVGGTDAAVLDFVTTTDSRSRVQIDREYVVSSICEVGYRVRRSETADGLFAIYRREDFGVDDEPLEGGKFYKLADRVVEFTIHWFDEDPGDPDAWEDAALEEWDAEKEKGLPWACKITLKLMPNVELDSNGEPVDDVEEITFIRYVAFKSRFDQVPQ